MKRMRLVAAVLACLVAQPALAQQMRQGDAAIASEAEAAANLDALHADLAAYGAWLVRLNKSIEPALAGLRDVQAKWAEGGKTPPGAAQARILRPALAEAKARIAGSMAQVKALDRPTISILPVEDDLDPEALVSQTLTLLEKFDGFVGSMEAMLTAMSTGNAKAMETGARQMFVAVRLIYDTQITLTNAYLVTADAERSEHDVLLVDRTLYATGSRVLLSVERMMSGQSDAGFANDLDRLAAELDTIAVRGKRRVSEEIAVFQSDGDTTGANGKIIAKAIASAQLQNRVFDIAERFAGEIRAGAAGTRKARTLQSIFAVAVRLSPARQMMDQVGVEQAEVLAQ